MVFLRGLLGVLVGSFVLQFATSLIWLAEDIAWLNILTFPGWAFVALFVLCCPIAILVPMYSLPFATQIAIVVGKSPRAGAWMLGLNVILVFLPDMIRMIIEWSKCPAGTHIAAGLYYAGVMLGAFGCVPLIRTQMEEAELAPMAQPSRDNCVESALNTDGLNEPES